MSQAPDPRSPAGAGLEVAPGIYVDEAQLRLQYARSAGPGGQNVNKLNTKAELWVPVAALRGLQEDAASRLRQLAGRRLTRQDEIHIVAQASRTQEANRAAALDRLRELLVQALHRPRPRRPTRPTAASRRRRLDDKRRRGQLKSRRRAADES